jgi:hypothetical protein
MTTATNVATIQVYRVWIKATPQAIWDAITKPEWTDRYGYGGTVDYDLTPGARYEVQAGTGMQAMGSPGLSSTARSSRPTRRAGSSRPGGSSWMTSSRRRASRA